MNVRVRFAPSPTGLLHLGNARTAVVNWLFARKHQGAFVLRIDDTDRERSQERFIVAIREDLQWLGLDWDEEARQSGRGDVYDAAFARLREAGRVYPAYETAEELAAMRERQRARHLPPRYDRAALRLTEADRTRLEAEGRRPHWRFRLSEGAAEFDDLVRGQQRPDLRHLSDPVLRREDGAVTYTFASVVDDLDLDITHVIRGEDHLTNTAVQLDIMQALGGRLPAFAHLPLILDERGGKLSKRLEGLSLATLRERGVEPVAITAVLAALGTGKAPAPVPLADLVTDFDLQAYGTAQPRLQVADLDRLSIAMLRAEPFAQVKDKLQVLGLKNPTSEFWHAISSNVAAPADVKMWSDILTGALQPVVQDRDLLSRAADALQTQPDPAAWLDELKRTSGRKGKALYGPLRLALTAREHDRRSRIW